MAAVMDAARIGRFDIMGTLGRGAQGTVYLAQDSRLGRRVAVKTLRMDRLDVDQRASETETMLGEARIVGKLSHPNLVALFDAGEDDGRPYLVFEFVEGKTLGELIRERGTIAPLEAVRIALGLLAAVDYAHEAGVVHRDLKPANIMMTKDGVPRVMDFGIASHHTQTVVGQTGEQGISGTPSYMAPEYLSGATFTPRCDVFAAGMVLYEMLTGAPAIKAETPYQTMFQMVKEPFPRPSTRNAAVDEKLEAIVMRSLEKDPLERHASAADMAEALKAYLKPPASQDETIAPAGDAGGGTLEFLLRRMRYKSDFPVLSSTISTVNNLVASENEPTSALADSILKDVSLTNKLLRMVNTAYFQQFGGSVSTVSRAVSILGFQKVRNAALSLMLFEHLQNKAQAADLKDHVSSSYFSGVVSRDLVAKVGVKNAEEAFICSMFHRLGRLLAVFYLHEESLEVKRVAKARGVEEDVAAVEVIGMSYTDLGLGVAKQWNLPERIVSSMKAAAPGPLGNSDEARLRALASASNKIADAVAASPGRARDLVLKKIEGEYGKAFGLDTEDFETLMAAAAESFSTEVRSLGLPTGSGEFMQSVRALDRSGGQTMEERAAATQGGAARGGAGADGAGAAAARALTGAGQRSIPREGNAAGGGATGVDNTAETVVNDVASGEPDVAARAATVGRAAPGGIVRKAAAAGGNAGDAAAPRDGGRQEYGNQPGAAPGLISAQDAALAETMLDTLAPDLSNAPAGLEPAARAHMLSAGIQDITNTLAGDYQLNDVLRIILETMYRAIGFTRVMLCTRDPQTNSLRGRLGFGEQADVIIKRGFHVPLEVSKDVFYGSISKLADICIEDRESERIRAYIPEWYRKSIAARGFVLFPVAVNKRPVALIYADHIESGRLRFADGELNLLKTLRNQAILAIRQKSIG